MPNTETDEEKYNSFISEYLDSMNEKSLLYTDRISTFLNVSRYACDRGLIKISTNTQFAEVFCKEFDKRFGTCNEFENIYEIVV